jgi:hypothetical protein
MNIMKAIMPTHNAIATAARKAARRSAAADLPARVVARCTACGADLPHGHVGVECDKCQDSGASAYYADPNRRYTGD